MSDTNEQILSIEKEIRETPYHKGTERHIGLLRARISRLKDKLLDETTKKGGGGGGYAVKKQGDATVVLVGPPSSGKSTLLNRLTNAQSKVAPYAFTTVSVIPGMMEYKNAKIQILDVPGLIEGAEEGKGRGKEVISVVRGSDLIILFSDVKRLSAFERIEKALSRNGIRLNQNPPQVAIKKRLSGGVIVHSNIKQGYSKETVKEISEELGLKNAEITIKEELPLEKLIDAFSKNRVYIPAIKVVNKIDEVDNLQQKEKEIVYISAEKGENLDILKETIWKYLNFVTIYLVKPNEEPTTQNPIICKNNETLKEVGEKLGSDFLTHKKSAVIWGAGAKYEGQEVSLITKVIDGMKVKFV